MREAKRCVECGLGQIAWKENHAQGYLLYGEWYCCRGCAQRSGCTCIERDAEASILPSDRFSNSEPFKPERGPNGRNSLRDTCGD